MVYFSCLTCPPHSTLDHDLHGKGPCLFPDCPCLKMEQGPEFVKQATPRLSQEDALKAAAERGARERDA